MTDAPLRLVLGPSGEELAAARRVEAEVFYATYANTPEELADEYDPYETSTDFMAILDDENGEAVAACRIISPGPAGLKSLNDVGRPPWGVDGLRSARAAGVDPERTWDIATIAVRRGAGRGGLCAGALYHGIATAAAANGIEFLVMIMDAHARKLLTGLSIATQVLPGTSTGEYLGSASSTPLWINLPRMFEQMRHESPDAYRLIFGGVGLDGIILPTDWTWPGGASIS